MSRRIKLIPNASRVLLHSYSQRINLIALAGIGAYGALPDKLQDALPTWAVVSMACALLLLGIVGRLIEQPELKESSDDGRTE